MAQERSERAVRYIYLPGTYPESTHPRGLVRGDDLSPDVDEFALFLQPVADDRRNSRSRTVKLIHF